MQQFNWLGRRCDITRLLTDISERAITPALINLSPEFVSMYGQTLLVRGEAGRFAIDVLHVLTQSQDMLHDPPSFCMSATMLASSLATNRKVATRTGSLVTATIESLPPDSRDGACRPTA